MFSKIKEHRLVFCFLVPFFILFSYYLLLLISSGFTYLANDCYYQYVPFYEYLRTVVHNGEIFEIFTKGTISTDFYGIFCYYLSSPLNLLLFFVPSGGTPYFVSFMIILKLSLCGLSMGYFLKNKFEDDKHIILFSCIWTFCGYFAGYLWNIMWLDAIFWFPIILIGMDDLIYKKKPIKYVLSLAIAIFSNYFMGFIICIFLFLRFFTMKFKDIKDFFISGFRFAFCSICSALMSCVIILPSYFTLKATSISNENFNDHSFEKLGDWYTTFESLLIGQWPNAITNNAEKANLYVSLFVVLLLFLYLISKKIALLDKLRNLFLIVVLSISLNIEILNFIWHGFHKQNGIPNRFSFIIIFIAIYCAYEISLKLKDISIIEKIFAFIICEVFYYSLYDKIASDKLEYILITMFLVLFYFLGILWNKVFYPLIFIEIIVLFLYGSSNVSINFTTHYNHFYDDFKTINKELDNDFYREKFAEVGANVSDDAFNKKNRLFDKLDFGTDDFDFKGFFDEYKNVVTMFEDIDYRPMSNECTYLGLDNLSLFNTFTNAGMQKFMFKTGNTGSSNTIRYSRDNVALDMFFGVKYDYVVDDERYNTNFAYDFVKTYGKVDVYENKYALVPFYLVDSNVDIEEISKVNQFEALNVLFEGICGIRLFNEEVFRVTDLNHCKVSSLDSSYVKITEMKGNSVIGIEYLVDTYRNDYLHLHHNELSNAKIFINNELIIQDKFSQRMLEIGELKPGDKVRIEIYNENVSESGYNLFLYSLNQDAYEKAYNILSKGQLNVEKYEANYLKGNINKSGKLLITIPYSNYWKAYVNGKEVEIEKFADTFMLINLEDDFNEIELKYNNYSITYGFILSILGLILFSLYYVFINRRYKFNKNMKKEGK